MVKSGSICRGILRPDLMHKVGRGPAAALQALPLGGSYPAPEEPGAPQEGDPYSRVRTCVTTTAVTRLPSTSRQSSPFTLQ